MFDVTVLRIFMASPGDMGPARDLLEDVLRDWNSRNGKDRQIFLQSRRWELDAAPRLHRGGPQSVLNEDLVSDADLLVGLFGKRLGTRTPRAISGTVEEIQQFDKAQKPVLLYFSDQSATRSRIDPRELRRVEKFRNSIKGLSKRVKRLADLQREFRNDLDTTLRFIRPILIPAAKALAYGYSDNFIKRVHDMVGGGTRTSQMQVADLGVVLRFETSHINIAKPKSLDDMNDAAAHNFRERCAEISIFPVGSDERRAFRIYIREELRDDIDKARAGGRKEIRIKHLDIFDFPTPLNVLREFIRTAMHNLPPSSKSRGYWLEGETKQYSEFFKYTRERNRNHGLGNGRCKIGTFAFKNSPRFKLPS